MKRRVVLIILYILIILSTMMIYSYSFYYADNKKTVTFKLSDDVINDSQSEIIYSTDNSQAKYIDSELVGNDPIVEDGMIPVYYDENSKTWKKASLLEQWYDYKNQWWANVVVAKDEYKNKYDELNVGEDISLDEIYGFFVWIPRFEYKLFNVNNSLISPQTIEVNIVPITDKKTKIENNNYYTHPAFTATYSDGSSYELNGFWIAKFEPSLGSDGNIYLLPNKKPLVNIYMYQMWQYSTGISKTYNIDVESRIINNMEWGAITYFTTSKYGKSGNNNYNDKRVYINNAMGNENWDNLVTGCSSGTVNYGPSQTCAHRYDEKIKGTGASSTGNIYGIYDLSGGAWECIMGIISDNGVSLKATNKEQLPTESRYYTIYKSGLISDTTRGYIGDVTRETKQSYEEHASWYGNNSYFATKDYPWIKRGGSFRGGSYTGLFDYGITNDLPRGDKTFRTILSKY